VECGVARIVGEDAENLLAAFEEALKPGSWASQIRAVANPFGQGDSARRIVDAIRAWYGARTDSSRDETAAASV
jgi:UDP-N-acetylglucosamine 2-epimerase